MMRATVVIPTFNGAGRITPCIQALGRECAGTDVDILVVDDGSTDATAEIAISLGVRVLRQVNAGPAAARNHGAREAAGSILLFTDDDCVPEEGWLGAMLEPFADEALVGAKGIYRTRQRELTARFVQLEYEDKYRIMAAQPAIDFIDTYSAAFRRERFIEMGGYDTSFPVACAEDIELSYRMSAQGWLMRFVPAAAVYHTHPARLWAYLRKKYKFAYWRVFALSKNPQKAAKDSHTPQLMKLQLLLLPALLLALVVGAVTGHLLLALSVVLLGFLLTTLPFALRAISTDPVVGCLSPLFLAARAVAQFLGVAGGLLYVQRHRSKAPVASTLPL